MSGLVCSDQQVAASAFDVVAVGASLGGPVALRRLMSLLPAELPAAVLVVQHRSPTSTSRLSALLQRGCPLRVKDAEHGEPIARGTVYTATAPSGWHLQVDGEHRVQLSDGPRVAHAKPSLDVLFESVATVYGERAVGVVLTGSQSDGAAGVRAIKRARGRVLVQDRETAQAFGMPGAALATGCVDFVLPLDSIAAAIVALVSVPGAAALFRVATPPWAHSA